MSRTAVVAALVAVCAVGVAQAGAQTVWPLKRVEVQNSANPVVAGCVATLVPMQSNAQLRPPGSLPPGAYFSGTLGRAPLSAAWDERRADVLWLDTDRDGDLARETPLRCVSTRLEGAIRVRLFGPVAVAARQGATAGAPVKVEVFQVGTGSSYIRVFPATFLTGSVSIGGQSGALALVDGDCDGELTPGGPDATGDWLGIDRDGDGKIDPNWLLKTELMPLPKMLELAGGYYTLEITPSASGVRLTQVQPKFGALDVGTPDAQLIVWSDYGAMALPPGGRWQLPEGSYHAVRITLARKGPRGEEWRLSSSNPGPLSAFQIAPDQTQTLRVGTPLVAQGLVEGTVPSLQVSMKLTGQGGEEYQPGAVRNGITVPAPKFEVVDGNGRRLVSGQYEYG